MDLYQTKVLATGQEEGGWLLRPRQELFETFFGGDPAA
jgi:hypothetical protein